MKKLVFIFLCLPIFVSGQGWEKILGGTDFDDGRSVQQTTDGGYIITGGTESFGNGYVDVYLIKTDSNGVEQWYKTFGGASLDNSYSVQETTDGGYIITGLTFSFGNGEGDIYLIKTDGNGNSLWTKTFGGIGYDYGSSVQQTNDGGYIIAGTTFSLGDVDESDVYLIKTDANGDSLWSRTFGGALMDDGSSVQQTNDGGYVIVGSTSSFSDTISDVYLIKTDGNGVEQWFQTFGGVGYSYDYGNFVQQTTDGGYVITGEAYISGSSWNIYLIKTDGNGAEQWQQTYGGINTERGYSVQQSTDGGYIITGLYMSEDINFDVYLLKTNGSGIEQWNQTYGGANTDYGKSVQKTADGGYVIAGVTRSFGNGLNDVYLIKTDENGNSEPIFGCTNIFACNYNASANLSDTSCTFPGCTDATACNYDTSAGCDDGSCDLPNGCGDPLYLEYSASVTCADLLACNILIVNGCTDILACNYDSIANVDDGSCLTVYGCTNPAAINFNSLANCSDSCIFPEVIYGCVDSIAINYNPTATIDDNSCIYCSYGCTNIAACNYNSLATCDNGSCFYNIVWQQALSLCDGDNIVVGGNVYNTEGNYVDTLTTSNGCDSIVYTNILIVQHVVLEQNLPLCDEGDVVVVGSNVYNTEGNYIDILSTSNGCDSIVYTNIMTAQSIVWQQSLSLCYGDNITVGDNLYSTPGNYIDTLIRTNGCDSVVYTGIGVLPTLGLQQSFIICDGDNVVVGNSVYSTSGNYIDILTGSNGCDSTVYTNVILNNNIASYSYDTLTVVTSFMWNGLMLSVSGDYSVVLINSSGCDSIANLNLTVTNHTGLLNITNTEESLFKIVNVLGQETPYRRKTPLFYIYDDGTVEKRIVME